MKDVTPSVVAAVMALVVPVVAGAQGTAPLAADDAVAWCAAIADHIPGEPDTALFVAASWPSLRIERMLGALTDGMKRVARTAARDDDATARLREALAPFGLAREALSSGDLTRIVRRGAVLHTDIALLTDGNRDLGEGAPSAGSAASVTIFDGQPAGYRRGGGHLDVARLLLDRIRPSASIDPGVGAWYRAVAAHLMAHAEFGELRKHLAQGKRVGPRDGVLQMFDAAMHHALASPRVQAAMTTIVMPPTFSLDVKSSRAELDEARRGYEDALRLDPGLVEARLRLGRVRAEQGHPAEAADLLRSAARDAGDPVGQYFAALFLGEQEAALGRADEARLAFERASALFPNAQSPLLGLSHLARARGDRAAALEAIARVMRLPSRRDARDEPWWDFNTSAGRHADAWLADARRRLVGDAAQ